MEKKKKTIILITTLLSSCVLFTGCDKRVSQLKSENKKLNQNIESKDRIIGQLQKDIRGLKITEESPTTSLRSVEGSSVPEFVTIDGKIEFPTRLEMPNSTEAVNNSYILLGNKYRFVPSNNWLVKLQGNTLDCSHPSRVWGNLKAIGMKEEIQKDVLKEMLKSFFNSFPATNITYREAFIDSRNAGLIANAPITVDKKQYAVNVGVIQKGEYGVLILFVYEDDKSGVQQELIDLLISSGSYADYKISLE
ncbi:hypothetical protein Q3304_08605 [Clostridioides sp. GD02377]|uniref:hypothetical protein n=1 Tax=unclassified Clostridioides TaxID=2635829 RepID=UPI0038AC01FC